MFILLFKKFQKRSVYFYASIAFGICSFSYMLGSWSGGEVSSVYALESDLRGGCGNSSSPCAATFSFSPRVGGGAAHWLQGVRAYLVLDERPHGENSKLRFAAELFYFDESKKEPKKQWQGIAVAARIKDIHCSQGVFKKFMYGCQTLPIFELLSVTQNKYRFVIQGDFVSRMEQLKNFRLVLRHESVRFSQAKAYLKAFFCPLALFAHLWYHERHRPPFRTPLERILYAHSTTLVALNIPFEYFLMWMCPMWSLFVKVTEMAFLTTLYLSWVIFFKSLSTLEEGNQFGPHLSEPPADPMNSYRSHISMLFGWYILTISDGVERSTVIQDVFYTPMDYSINMFRELVLYELIWSVVVLIAGFTVVYQICQIYFKCDDILVDLKSGKFLYQKCVPFAICLFSCVSMAIIQFSHSLLLESNWKLRLFDCAADWCLVNHLLAPGIFTLFSGMSNVFSIVLLLLVPDDISGGWNSIGRLPIHGDESECLRCIINWRLQNLPATQEKANEKEIATVIGCRRTD